MSTATDFQPLPETSENTGPAQVAVELGSRNNADPAAQLNQATRLGFRDAVTQRFQGLRRFATDLKMCLWPPDDVARRTDDTPQLFVHATLDSCCGEMEYVDIILTKGWASTLFDAKEDALKKLLGSTAAITETRLYYSRRDPRESWWPNKFPYRLDDAHVEHISGAYVLVNVVGREVSTTNTI